jgi:hypothetical protein
MAQDVRRIITKFRRGCENRESETDVTAVPFEVICKLVPPGPDDPLLYDCYELNQSQLAAFVAYLSEEFETDRYDYYLEAETA